MAEAEDNPSQYMLPNVVLREGVASEGVTHKGTEHEHGKHGHIGLEHLGLLAGGIAHDFNNYLSVILGNSNLAHDHPSAEEGLDIYLSRIQDASHKAAILCKQMLNYAGHKDELAIPMRLTEVVHGITQLMEASLTKGVVLKYDLQDNLPFIHMNTALMQQVLMNLVLNANQSISTRNGQITLTTGVMDLHQDSEVTLKGNSPMVVGEYVFIDVADTGCGMDALTQAEIFKPFFTTKHDGHGMGIAAVVSVVTRHQGILQLRSKSGEGSVFRVAFPAVKTTVQEEEMVHEYDAQNQTLLSGKILLVDDEEIVVETMQVMLEDLGCEVVTARDGVEAIEIYSQRNQQIDLIILDLTMPKMSGKECVSQLASRSKHVKIILTSGYSKEEALNQVTHESVVGFLSKPCGIKNLYTTLRKAL